MLIFGSVGDSQIFIGVTTMTHRINNNEMDPKTECGLDLDGSIALATIHEPPTCAACLSMETGFYPIIT